MSFRSSVTLLSKAKRNIVKLLIEDLLEMHQEGAIELDQWPNAQRFIDHFKEVLR